MPRSQARAWWSKPARGSRLRNWRERWSCCTDCKRVNRKRLHWLGEPLSVGALGLLVDAAGQKASIDNQSLPGNEGSAIGGEEDCGSDQFFGLAEAAHGRPHQQFLAARRAVEQICIQGGAEDPGSDGVHGYALLRPLHGKRTRQRNNSGLAGRVSGHLTEGNEAVQRGDVDD